MSDKEISLEQGIQILSRAFASMRSNPPGWEDASPFGGSPGDVARMPRPRHGLGGEDDPSAYAPVKPGVGHPQAGDPPGWSSRSYAEGDMASNKYGPHNTVLSDQDAATLHLVWSIMGIDGDTVGKGHTIDIGPHNAPLRDKKGHLIPQGGAVKGTVMWGRPSGDYFNGMYGDANMENPLATPFNGFAQGFSGEQGEATPGYVAPAPYGYSTDGRPLQFPGESDALAQKVPISKYAPGREYGPTVNKYKPTEAESNAQSHDKRMN